MTTKSDDPMSPLSEIADLHHERQQMRTALANISGAMHDLHPQLVVPADPREWGAVLREWNATQLAHLVEPDEPARVWLAKWRESREAIEALLARHNADLPEVLDRWVYEPACFRLLRQHGQPAATVWMTGTWHTWDLQGTGGENAGEVTVDQALGEALKAVVRQEFDECPEKCEACDGTGYHDEGYEDPRVATMHAQLADARRKAQVYAGVARSRAALVDTLSGKLGPTAIADALVRAKELGGAPLDCSIVQLRATLRMLRERLCTIHRDLPRYPSLGSMGGGSEMEGKLRTKWEKDVGSWAETFTKLQDAVEGGLDLAERTLATETAREQQCAVCGKPVEEAGRCYAIPHCYACLPPPPPLEVLHIGGHEFVTSTPAERQVYENARHAALADNKPTSVPGNPMDSQGFGGNSGGSVVLSRQQDLDEAADAAHESMHRVDPLAELHPDERPKSPSPELEISTKGPFVECEWSPFSTCFTPKNWGQYGAPSTQSFDLIGEPSEEPSEEPNEGWYCAIGLVDGFRPLGIKATGDGDSQAAAELDAMRNLFPLVLGLVTDVPSEERARLLAIEIIARRMRKAVPK